MWNRGHKKGNVVITVEQQSKPDSLLQVTDESRV